jgi:preprotein translocase subunit SecY
LVLLWQPWFWRRLAVTAVCLVVWRALAQVVVPGVNPAGVLRIQADYAGNGFLHLIGGGALPVASYSLMVMGIAPYIYAVIIVSLLKVCFGTMRSLAETPRGSLRLRRWTRALGQAYGYTLLMQEGSALGEMGWFSRLVIVLALGGATMLLVLLADAIDAFGLGFGHGAVLIYALTPVGIEVHRLADALAGSPSPDRVYLPLAIWAIFTIAVLAGTVAVLGAVRHIQLPAGASYRSPDQTDLGLLMSGAIRPPIYAGAVLSLPAILSGYFTTSNPGLANAITAAWASDGLTSWTGAVRTSLHAGLVIGFTYFVVFTDFPVRHWGRSRTRRVARLTFVGAAFLALSTSVMPVLEELLTTRVGRFIPMNGYEVVICTAVVLAIFASAAPQDFGARRPSLQPELP